MVSKMITNKFILTFLILGVSCTIGFYYFVNRVATKTYKDGYFVSINFAEGI